jgi:hypothetical protein
MAQPESIAASKKKPPSARHRFYDAGFMREYGSIESSRAARFGSVFSVVVISAGDGAGKLSKEVASEVLKSTRISDVAGMLPDGRIALILPETNYFGSLSTIRKLSDSLVSPSADKPLLFSEATFGKDARSFTGLVEAAMGKLKEQRLSLREVLDIDSKLFWEIIGDIFANNYDGISNATFDAGASHPLSGFFIDQVNEMIVREIAQNPRRKGILYFSARKISPDLPIIRALGEAGVTATRVFLVGKHEGNLVGFKNATPVYLEDPRLADTFFTFFLSEDSGYALILRENWGETYACFHTSDPYLVEGLIYKFQTEYSLQEQLG